MSDVPRGYGLSKRMQQVLAACDRGEVVRPRGGRPGAAQWEGRVVTTTVRRLSERGLVEETVIRPASSMIPNAHSWWVSTDEGKAYLARMKGERR